MQRDLDHEVFAEEWKRQADIRRHHCHEGDRRRRQQQIAHALGELEQQTRSARVSRGNLEAEIAEQQRKRHEDALAQKISGPQHRLPTWSRAVERRHQRQYKNKTPELPKKSRYISDDFGHIPAVRMHPHEPRREHRLSSMNDGGCGEADQGDIAECHTDRRLFYLGNNLSGAVRWHEWQVENTGSAKIGFELPFILVL